MLLSIEKDQLLNYVVSQVNYHFPDGNEMLVKDISEVIDQTLDRVEYCFSKINNKYFFNGVQSNFNHLNGDQYCMFLYLLSNTMYRNGLDVANCSKIYLLNKALHGIDVYYEVELPAIFLFIHPLATVLGRANYSDYLLVYQRCGVGSNKNVYPTLGKFLTLHPGSSILGESVISDGCSIAAESLVLDTSLERDSIYIGNPKKYFTTESNNKSSFWIL